MIVLSINCQYELKYSNNVCLIHVTWYEYKSIRIGITNVRYFSIDIQELLLSSLGINILGINFDRVDVHKNINGTNKRRINNSLKYSVSRLSRYVDKEL